MNDQKKEQLADIHDHVEKALSILTQHFTINETEKLNKQAEHDIEATLRHTANVMKRLLAVNGKLPLKALESIERMYAKGVSMEEIEKAEQKAEADLEVYRHYKETKEKVV